MTSMPVCNDVFYVMVKCQLWNYLVCKHFEFFNLQVLKNER